MPDWQRAMNATQLAAVDRSIRQENKCLTMETPPRRSDDGKLWDRFGGKGSLTRSSFESDSVEDTFILVEDLTHVIDTVKKSKVWSISLEKSIRGIQFNNFPAE